MDNKHIDKKSVAGLIMLALLGIAILIIGICFGDTFDVLLASETPRDTRIISYALLRAIGYRNASIITFVFMTGTTIKGFHEKWYMIEDKQANTETQE